MFRSDPDHSLGLVLTVLRSRANKAFQRIKYNYLGGAASTTDISTKLIPKMRTIVYQFRAAFILKRK